MSKRRERIVWSGKPWVKSEETPSGGWFYITCTELDAQGNEHDVEFRDQTNLDACLRMWAVSGMPNVVTVGRFG